MSAVRQVPASMLRVRKPPTIIVTTTTTSARFQRHHYYSTDYTTAGGVRDSSNKTNDIIHVAQPSGLERLPTRSLWRNLILGAAFTSPLLFKMGFGAMRYIADSRSRLLNPDSNPFLRALIKPLVYDQFCAGTNQREIGGTRRQIRRMGFSGVILCYGKEIQVSGSNNEIRSTGAGNSDQSVEIDLWKKGNLETLDMIGEGDWVGMKFTGAGPGIVNALMNNEDCPPQFTEALDAICHKAREQRCRLWVDAEQQVLQTAIDRWTLDVMRKHNRDGHALVYGTIQAYLKTAREKLKAQLGLAEREGWTLGVKLVRGAYIANDRRDLIHDTKQDTDDSYNGIVRDLLSGTNDLGSFFAPKEDRRRRRPPHPPPRMQLFLAGHNPESVNRAWDLVQQLSARGQLRVLPEFGQLQGMADELGCTLVQRCEDVARENAASGGSGGKAGVAAVPAVYKCLTWGSIQECMQYLIRRAVENSGGAERMKDGMAANYAELKRRTMARLRV